MADVLTAWRVRNAALAVAASFVHPGPDGEDEAARRRLVREWVDEGHDAVADHDRQFHQAVARMVAAEREVERLTAAAATPPVVSPEERSEVAFDLDAIRAAAADPGREVFHADVVRWLLRVLDRPAEGRPS